MKLKTLIIDDDPLITILLKKMIEEHESLELSASAENGEAAIHLLKATDIDLVFLDIYMPDMTGFEVLDQVERQERTQIIIVSGSDSHGIEAFEYGVTDYLVKPFSKERFNTAVSKVITKSKKRGGATNQLSKLNEKIVQYIHSRGIFEFSPFPFREAKLGYIYPMLTSNLDFKKESQALDILDAAEKEGYLTSNFMDSFYCCNSCKSNYLLIRESCPKCGSTSLGAEEQVHHFACGYVGPISDFYKKNSNSLMNQSNSLECPKCNKTLQHIGVDYDKPSTMFLCTSCKNRFQNPVVLAKCTDCQTNTPVENLVKTELKSYELTTLGRDAAMGKVAIDIEETDELADLMDRKQFTRAIEREIERVRSYVVESSVFSLRFVNFQQLQKRIGGAHRNKLIRELYELILNKLDRSSEITFLSTNTIAVFTPEMDVRSAEFVSDSLAQEVAELLFDNFDGFKTEIERIVLPVEEDQTAGEVLNLLMQGETLNA